MIRLLTLPRLALAVWMAWLLLLVTSAGFLILRLWHPHFLPLTAIFVFFLAAGLSLVVRAVWRVIRGPDRLRSLAWFLFGTAPVWLMAGHFLYGLDTAYGRQVPMSYVLKVLVPLGESLMDLESRFRYPQRSVGEKVVMISAPAADASEQVAAMDEHVRQIEKRLGRSIEGRVHWARGPLFGMQGKAIVGLCMGTRQNEAFSVEEGLDYVDRHEVAHCAIHAFCPPSIQPPTLLVEGWAEANSGHDPGWLAARAWEYHEGGTWRSLRELSDPHWSGRFFRSVYVQGAPFVNYLLDEFGSEKFLELYTTCRRATFAEDCQRVLGMSLDEIETGCLAEIERLVYESGSDQMRRLAQMTLAPSIDRAEWLAFLDAYLPAAQRLLAVYDYSRQTIQWQHEFVDVDGQIYHRSRQWKSIRSGEYLRLLVKYDNLDRVYLAHPQNSLSAKRTSEEKPWQLRPSDNSTAQLAYRQTRRRINASEYHRTVATILLSEDFPVRSISNGLVLADWQSYRKADESLIRLRFENRRPRESLRWRAATFVLAEDDCFALRWKEVEYAGDSGSAVSRTELAYDRHNGLPVFRSMTTTQRSSSGSESKTVWRVIERDFGPTPEEEFTAERVLGTNFIESPPPSTKNDAAGPFAIWYQAFLLAGVISLPAGLVLLSWTSRVRRNSVATVA